MKTELIAPCGINCAVCAWYLAREHDIKSRGVPIPYCEGYRPRDKKCAQIVKKCDLLRRKKARYCFECPDFPCLRLKRLDERYRARHHMSVVENLEHIRDKGIAAFLAYEDERWKCPRCGELISCHNGLCFKCGLDDLRRRKPQNMYRWLDKTT